MDEFDYERDFRTLDFRRHPELYQIGRGEQGVLSVEPYKSEILPHWRFKTPEIAEGSATQIYKMFCAYRKQRDFVGMDMARKFLQMGYTRARRYANHGSGRKYDTEGQEMPREENPEKAEAARIFYGYYLKAREDQIYQNMKENWPMVAKTRKKSTSKKKKKKAVSKKKTAQKKTSRKKAKKKAVKKTATQKKTGTKKKTKTAKKSAVKKSKKKTSKKKKPAGLYANIHKAQQRAKRGGRPVRKNGEAGAPTEKAFKESAKTAKS